MAKTKFLSEEIREALTKFGHSRGSDSIAASGTLVAANALVLVAREPSMRSGLLNLLQDIREGSNVPKILSLARLWHLTAQAPLNRMRDEFAEALSPLPNWFEPISSLQDPSDRRYAAEALDHLGGGWLAEYLAQGMAEEESGERARSALAVALLRHTKSLNQAIVLLAETGRQLIIDSKDRGASRARRLIRVSDALAAAIIEIDPQVEKGIGEAIGAMVSAFMRHELPSDKEVTTDLGLSVFKLSRTIIRFHGTLAAEAGTFDFVPVIRRLFSGTDWPDRMRSEAQSLARMVREALLFLAGRSIAADDLRAVHVALVGEIQTGLDLRRSVETDGSIPAELSNWLITGRAPRTIRDKQALENTVLQESDEDLARAYLEAVSATQQLDSIESDLLTEARMMSPGFGENAESAFGRVRRILRYIDKAAKKRGFFMRGERGEIMPYSNREHTTIDGRPASRAVRLRTPLIERHRANGSVDIILKAEVEQLRDNENG